MGIRINTVLGYGFRYCRGSRDPRFSPWVFGDESSHPSIKGVMDVDLRPLLVAHLKRALKAVPPEPETEGAPDPHWARRHDLQWELCAVQRKGIWSPGEGDPKEAPPITFRDIMCVSGYSDSDTSIYPVVFTHPLQKDWFRYDDIIDYYSGPDAPDGGIMDHVFPIVGDGRLPKPIYPFDGYVNRRTGQRITGQTVDMSTSFRSAIIQEWLKGGAAQRRISKHVLQSLKSQGIASMVGYQRDITPIIPTLIVEACAMLGVFKDPLTVYRLRPMIYRYWC